MKKYAVAGICIFCCCCVVVIMLVTKAASNTLLTYLETFYLSSNFICCYLRSFLFLVFCFFFFFIKHSHNILSIKISLYKFNFIINTPEAFYFSLCSHFFFLNCSLSSKFLYSPF